MIKITQTGDFSKTEKFLKHIGKLDMKKTLDKYGQRGVDALRNATPQNSGATAISWSYTIKTSKRGASITWTNDNVAGGVPIAILIQYGHATGTGGYVAPRDFINPAMKSIFATLADEIWMEVKRG